MEIHALETCHLTQAAPFRCLKPMCKNAPLSSSLVTCKYWLFNHIEITVGILCDKISGHGTDNLCVCIYRGGLAGALFYSILTAFFITSYFYNLQNFAPTIMHLCMICPTCIQIAYCWNHKKWSFFAEKLNGMKKLKLLFPSCANHMHCSLWPFIVNLLGWCNVEGLHFPF